MTARMVLFSTNYNNSASLFSLYEDHDNAMVAVENWWGIHAPDVPFPQEWAKDEKTAMRPLTCRCMTVRVWPITVSLEPTHAWRN